MDAVALQQPLDVVVDGGGRQDVVGELKRDLGADHLVAANSGDHFDGRLQVGRLHVVGDLQHDEALPAGRLADGVSPKYGQINYY